MITKLVVNGMICNHCKDRIESELMKVPGVISALVTLEHKCVDVDTNSDVDGATLKAAIEKAGYQVAEINGEVQGKAG